jgi:regulatory protein
MDYLSRREHSRLELQQKLLQKEWSFHEVDVVLDQLIQDNLQSDERFAEAYLHTKMKAGYGPRWIHQALLSRGVSDEIIDRLLMSIDGWFDALQALWTKKYGQLPMTVQERAKQSRFLLSKGFDAQSVHRCLSAPLDD